MADKNNLYTYIGKSNGPIHIVYDDNSIPKTVRPVSTDNTDTATEGEDNTSSDCWLYISFGVNAT